MLTSLIIYCAFSAFSVFSVFSNNATKKVPQNIAAVVGERVKLECKYPNSTHKLQWRFSNITDQHMRPLPIYIEGEKSWNDPVSKQYSIEFNNGSIDLVISNVSKKYSGSYSCLNSKQGLDYSGEIIVFKGNSTFIMYEIFGKTWVSCDTYFLGKIVPSIHIRDSEGHIIKACNESNITERTNYWFHMACVIDDFTFHSIITMTEKKYICVTFFDNSNRIGSIGHDVTYSKNIPTYSHVSYLKKKIINMKYPYMKIILSYLYKSIIICIAVSNIVGIIQYKVQ